LQVHKSNADMQKSIDKNVLPKEYGGDVPIKDMIGQSLVQIYLIQKNPNTYFP